MGEINRALIVRNMKFAPTFVRSDVIADAPLPVVLEVGELLVGWYRNPPPWSTSVLVFTSHALYLGDGSRFERLALDDIVDYDVPREKRSATGMRLRTLDGIRFVRMAGRNGENDKFCDVFNFVMVVHMLVHTRKPGPRGLRRARSATSS